MTKGTITVKLGASMKMKWLTAEADQDLILVNPFIVDNWPNIVRPAESIKVIDIWKSNVFEQLLDACHGQICIHPHHLNIK